MTFIFLVMALRPVTSSSQLICQQLPLILYHNQSSPPTTDCTEEIERFQLYLVNDKEDKILFFSHCLIIIPCTSKRQLLKAHITPEIEKKNLSITFQSLQSFSTSPGLYPHKPPSYNYLRSAP